jgi:tRNA-splicing ligase RtcB (3'-phosphate/5'-hydroxy nucleic acid ligase)
VHFGKGATVGLVIACRGAIVPAAVGADIGCGMMAVRCSLSAAELPDSLKRLRLGIEAAVPHGGVGRKGGWKDRVPTSLARLFRDSGLDAGLKELEDKHPALRQAHSLTQLGSLGGGNHTRSASMSASVSGSCCTRAQVASATASAAISLPRPAKPWSGAS